MLIFGELIMRPKSYRAQHFNCCENCIHAGFLNSEDGLFCFYSDDQDNIDNLVNLSVQEVIDFKEDRIVHINSVCDNFESISSLI